ncbi:hypothetical protein [Aquibacillus rhizosphaerae]|uniref:Uncharacterized protein n=1 Tax=Aquibacillus rhizosphaerae TaxID=3051431 RepID=A0ABT7L917_9BACI|nr:hypothetical protein [Aquibacillus sp. LR5S19]MDL4842358.1 hypothetical protein [Aquibacillus sp. LR5S19]
MKKILFIFTVCFLPFGLIMSIVLGDFIIGMMSGLFFGLLMTITLGILNKSMGGKLDSSVRQETEFKIDVSFKEALELCKESISSVKGAQIKQEDYANGIIRVKTSMTLKSWGEKIVFRVQKINDEVSNVYVQSKPTLPTTLVDYGKNSNNINNISSYFDQI